jgi:PEGA domain
MSRVIAVMACGFMPCGFMLAACSTTMPSLDFMKPAPQAESLAIESEPPGAEAKTSLGQSCRTPCQLSIQPGSEFSVTLSLSGYQPQTVSVRPEAEGATAAPRLAPNPVHADLQAVAPPKKPVAKKKKLVAAAARPAATAPMASAAPKPAPTSAPALTSAPSALTEMAPSATNYPWPSR